VKVLTLNTWGESGPWQERWEVACHGIDHYKPDILGFQEVFGLSWAEKIKKKTGFPHMVFPPERSGLMLLSRYAISRWECLTMKTKSPTEDYLRYVLFAELEMGQDQLAVFNTHLSWKLDEGNAREKQVEELVDFVDEKAGTRESLAMGDFNASSETPEIKKMMVQGKFTDTYAVRHRKERGLTWDNNNPYVKKASVYLPDRRIDYIFIRNHSRILRGLKSVEVVFTDPDSRGIFASDHFGVLASFEGS